MNIYWGDVPFYYFGEHLFAVVKASRDQKATRANPEPRQRQHSFFSKQLLWSKLKIQCFLKGR